MTKAEKYSWASLIATGAVYWYFQMRMLDGWAIAEQSPGALLGVYVTVVVLAIIAEAIIAGALAVSGRRARVEKDERDHAIEAKANRNAFYFLCAAVNVIVIQAIADAAFPGNIFPRIELTTLSGLFFALFAALFAASGVKLISTLVYYRR